MVLKELKQPVFLPFAGCQWRSSLFFSQHFRISWQPHSLHHFAKGEPVLMRYRESHFTLTRTNQSYASPYASKLQACLLEWIQISTAMRSCRMIGLKRLPVARSSLTASLLARNDREPDFTTRRLHPARNFLFLGPCCQEYAKRL
jgi:hypothetical protein